MGGGEICFGSNQINNVIADADGNAIEADWGECYTDSSCASGMYDCNGVCDGPAVFDECEVCDGDGPNIECWDGSYACEANDCLNEQCMDDPDVCIYNNYDNQQDCEGNGGLWGAYLEHFGTSCEEMVSLDNGCDIQILYWTVSDICPASCGVCCDEEDACNLNGEGSCEYNDCAGECGGSAVVDECGICDGPGSVYECGCTDMPDGACDCNGNVEDECGVCGGDGSTCELDCDSEVCLAIDNVDIDAGTLDIYITNSEPVAGFQFELLGITILGITGGSASQYFDFVEFNSSAGSVLGVSLIGSSIPPGSSLLITISFTDYLGSDICFGTNTDNNVISNSAGFDLDTDWGACSCDPSNPEDECGVCGGPGASYECGCNDISAVDNDTENIITITSYSWFEDLHYDFTFTIGDIIWQEIENAERRIDELRVYCHETGQIWEFDSDQLRSGTRDRDYSEVMDKYEDFTPPDNRPTDAYLYGWDGSGGGQYFWLEFDGIAWSDEGDYFDFWMIFDFWPGDEISFPNLEFEYGEFNSSDMPNWWAEGSFYSHFLDEWNFLQDQVMTIGLPACDCDGNVEDVCGECGGDGIVDGACDCNENIVDECGICGGDNSSCTDCAGVPNGDNEEDMCGTCDSDSSNDCVKDCAGTWGGDLVFDECGVCGGDDSTCDFDCNAEVCLNIINVDTLAGTLDIYMINSEPIAGFQFELFGMTITGVSGGTAEEYFDFVFFNAGSGMVLGASFALLTIPDGEGILTQVTFSDYNNDQICFGTNFSTNVISSEFGTGFNTEWGPCDDPTCPSAIYDCLGACDGDAYIDICGICDGGIDNSLDCMDISVSPESLSQDLEIGEMIVDTLTISNTGGSDLEWSSAYLIDGAYLNDVETGQNGWTHDGDNDYWHISDHRNYSQSHSWYVGNEGSWQYNDQQHCWLVSSVINIAENANLSFRHWADIELHNNGTEAWDGGIVEISTDGFSWDQIEPEGGYPYTIYSNTTSPFPGGTPCFSGSLDWELASFDLSSFSGEDVQIRFRFGSDGAVIGEGWYIDDIRIDNLPIWLDLMPVNGNVTPGSSEFIQVTFDAAGLNSGDYTADIVIISNDPDESEVTVPVSLSVCDNDCSESPEGFTFNQSSSQAFYYVLSGTDLYGAPLEPGDWVGLFNGDICVGAREWPGEEVDIPAMGDDGFEYSAGYLQAGDIPTFRIYDVSENLIYNAQPGENYEFADAQIFFVDEINGMLEYELSLHEGANFKSFYTLPDDNSIENVIGEDPDNITSIIAEGISAAFMNGQWIGTLLEFDLTDGYWFLTNNPETLSGYGTNYDPGRVYDLHYGANLISYSSLDSADLSSSIPDDVEDLFLGILSEGSAAMNTESGWVGSLTSFDGGMGYWVIVSEDLTFSYETEGMARAEIRRYVELLPAGSAFKVAQSPQQAFYFVDNITLDEGIIEEGDWLLSYNGNVLTGIRQWQGVMIDIPAMGLSDSKGTEGYLEEGDVPSFKLLRQDGELINLIKEDGIPQWKSLGVYMLGDLMEEPPLPKSYSLRNAYPNPFNPVTNIRFELPEDARVEIIIYDQTGRLVESLISNNYNAGYHALVWNANHYSSGIYFVNMHANTEKSLGSDGKNVKTRTYHKTQKIMLVK